MVIHVQVMIHVIDDLYSLVDSFLGYLNSCILSGSYVRCVCYYNMVRCLMQNLLGYPSQLTQGIQIMSTCMFLHGTIMASFPIHLSLVLLHIFHNYDQCFHYWSFHILSSFCTADSVLKMLLTSYDFKLGQIKISYLFGSGCMHI